MACLGNRFNPLCHEAVAPLQANQAMSMLTIAITPLPGPLAFSAIASFCQSLWTLSASAPKYLLVFKKKTYYLLPSCLLPCKVSNSYSQLLVLLQLHLSSPVPKETILETRQAKRQWLRQLTQTRQHNQGV